MTDQHDQPRPAVLRSFGRRRGRKLSPHQQHLMQDVLPTLAIAIADPAPTPLTKLFQARVSQVWLEIGFGGAEHLLWQAAANPDVGIIGCEPFEEGVVKAITAVQADGLRNVRLYPDDVRALLDWLPPASLDRVFILFPDPWPKKRHAKRRLVSTALLAQLRRVMRPGAELRLATDISVYARDMLLALRRSGGFTWRAQAPSDWTQRPSDWPQTRYERKALREGRRSVYLTFTLNGTTMASGSAATFNISS